MTQNQDFKRFERATPDEIAKIGEITAQGVDAAAEWYLSSLEQLSGQVLPSDMRAKEKNQFLQGLHEYLKNPGHQ